MDTSLSLPRGFQWGAVRAGIKPSGKPDLACALAEAPVAAAAMFTSNQCVAAPVIAGRSHLQHTRGFVRAVVVNAGNANCATGDAGLRSCEDVCAAAASLFGCTPQEVFPSSTGIIGVPLPAGKILNALPALREALGSSHAHLDAFATAIMTTDTRPKVAQACIEITGKQVAVAGVAKGAGMIHPQLVSAPTRAPHATMLVYLFTDLATDAALLAGLLQPAVERSFNRISIDGDTSTNDTVLLLASGASGATLHDDAARTAFASALHDVAISLARQILADGEGVTHVVELEISGAASDADALRVAKAIAHSPLVKTAWAGSDPNWGRLLAAIGYSGAAVDPARIHIRLGNLDLCVAGQRAPRFDAAAAHALLQQPEFTLHIELGLGTGSCRFWTTDLTAEYVRVNAEYST